MKAMTPPQGSAAHLHKHMLLCTWSLDNVCTTHEEAAELQCMISCTLRPHCCTLMLHEVCCLMCSLRLPVKALVNRNGNCKQKAQAK